MTNNLMSRIVPYLLTLIVLAPGIALAQDTATVVPPMDPFCADHFAGSHDHGRRCAVCEEEFLARCENVDGKIDACPCTHFLDPARAIDPTTLTENGKVLFEECVRYGYLALEAAVPDLSRTPIDKAAVLAALDAAIVSREASIKAEERLGRDMALFKAYLKELKETRALAARDITRIDVATLLQKLPPATPPPPPKPKGPTLVEGVGVVAGGTVIGAGVGAGIGLGTSATVLGASSLGGPVGLVVGLAVVLIWEGVSD